MSEMSCPVSGRMGGAYPVSTKAARVGPRGCNFSSFSQQGDLHAAFEVPSGADPAQYLRQRERLAINQLLYSDVPSMPKIKQLQNDKGIKSLDTLNANDQDLLAIALGAPARQVLLRAEEVGPRTGWRDGYLSVEHGFTPPDADAAAGALARSPGRIWSDLCERMPGCVARGRARESIAALPIIQGTEDIIPDKALWAALVGLGMLCSIYRYEDKHDGSEGVNVRSQAPSRKVEMSDDLGDEVKGIPKSIGLPYYQICKRMGRSIPHLTFFDQSSYNVKVRDSTSIHPYVGRFDNTDLRWPMFGDNSEIAFLKGCADTSASFQHGVDAIASCQEYVMSRNNESLLRELIRLKEILERMPNAFHTISLNPSSGDNYISPAEWVRWAKFSAPLSKRCPATSGLQFPPYLVMDAFLGRKKYDSFLGAEGVHLRAWLPSNWRAFIAAIEYYYSIPEYVARSNDQRLKGALDGIVEAYTGERGFMGTHRYKVFGLLEVAGKTGRAETNGNSGSSGQNTRPWEETHQAFSESMKERLEPYRGNLGVEPHQMRGTFAECRFQATVLSRSFVDRDQNRGIARVELDIQDTGITFQPGDRLAVMPLNSWLECAKVAAALGLDEMLDRSVALNTSWTRFGEHVKSVLQPPPAPLTIKDILRRGHLAPLTQNLVMKLHTMLRASSSTLLQVLATTEWPVLASLGDLLQTAVMETPPHIWDNAFDLTEDFPWLTELISVEVPRTYSISNYPDELLPSTVDLTVSRSEYQVCPLLENASSPTLRHGVGSSYLNPPMTNPDDFMVDDEKLLIGISRPLSFQLPIDDAAPCAFFAGGSGIAPFRSFWQARAGNSVGRNVLYLGVQSREKFCYEDELRDYINSGYVEVHTAFSRDTRGLSWDTQHRNLIEKDTPARYIDSLIIEQGASVCDMVMSKKQGGLGGYLYVCGSLSVFDSVMSGIRRAIYNHRSSSMESTGPILDIAFAERRFMLDIFMSPKPLPCNIPTIPLSELAMGTGHLPGSRVCIAVHGSVYDVTDFCRMHPGGISIIKSNAGVDCTKSFDLLAHTNNPEVSSLLNKYFIGHLAPKPDYHSLEEISMLYDLWSSCLRTTVETLVAQQFEVHEFMGSSDLWFQGSLFNMGGVRRFYHHESRLLQGGFSALFGAKFQELFLKLSFTLANSTANSSENRFPDVLGIIARAKTSPDAISTSQELSQIGQFTCNSEAARFHERGILSYAKAAVKLNMELLEGIREEACRGMDAFDTILEHDISSDTQRLTALSIFLLKVMERMTIRLEGFYSKLAQLSVYHPELEHSPARTRWNLLKRKIFDGSFFVLTQDMKVNYLHHSQSAPSYGRYRQEDIEFDQVISQIQYSIRTAPSPRYPSSRLTEQHLARGNSTPTGISAYENHENGYAIKSMDAFMNKNMKAIRRLSKLPANGVSLEQLMNTYRPPTPAPSNTSRGVGMGSPTPPRSRKGSQSSASSLSGGMIKYYSLPTNNLDMSSKTRSSSSTLSQNEFPRPQGQTQSGIGGGHTQKSHRTTASSSSIPGHVTIQSTYSGTNSLSSPSNSRPVSEALPSLFGKLNKRQSSGSLGIQGKGMSERERGVMRSNVLISGSNGVGRANRSLTGGMKSFVLGERE